MSSSENLGFAIAVTNPLLGVFNYVVLAMPQGWKLRSGPSFPEVYSSTKLEDIRWVTEGEAVHYAYTEDGAQALVVSIRVNKTRKKSQLYLNKTEVLEHGNTTMQSHPAEYAIGRVVRGFIKKKTRDFLRFSTYCEITDRTLLLDFEGRCRPETMKELVTIMQLSKCH